MPSQRSSPGIVVFAIFMVFYFGNSTPLKAQWNHIFTVTNNGPNGYLASSDVHFISPAEGYVFKSTWFSPSTGSILGAQKSSDYGSSWGTGFGFGNSANDKVIGAQSIKEDTTYVFIHNIGDHYKYTFDRGVTWTTQYVNNYQEHISSFHLINGTKGFITSCYTNSNGIKEISPSGQQWRFMSTTLDFTNSKIFFPNHSTGYAIAQDSTNKSVLLQSTDAGLNWHIQYYDTLGLYTFRDLCFINDSIGFMLISNSLLKTTDAGLSFYLVPMPLNEPIFDMVFFGDTLGYCISNYGAFYSTSDKGDTWVYNSHASGNVKTLQMLAPGFGYVLHTSNALFRLEETFAVEQFEVEPTLSVYPNPSTGTFYFSDGDKGSTQKMELYDMQGQLLVPSFEFTNPLKIDHFPPGNYIVRTIDYSSYQVIVKL